MTHRAIETGFATIRQEKTFSQKQKAPRDEGLLIIRIRWAKKERLQQFVKTLRYHSMRDVVLSTVCAYHTNIG